MNRHDAVERILEIVEKHDTTERKRVAIGYVLDGFVETYALKIRNRVEKAMGDSFNEAVEEFRQQGRRERRGM